MRRIAHLSDVSDEAVEVVTSRFFSISSSFWGCHGQVGVGRGYKISGRFMHLGREHLQETYAIEVNRDVTHKI